MSIPSDERRPEEFPFTEWQQGIEDAANRLPSRIRHRGRNAFVHLRKAWRLLGNDNEMAAFRALTAEEEASTALIIALQMKAYPGASRLNPRDHVHKNAFWPLIKVVNNVLAGSNFPAPQIVLARKGQPVVRVRLNLTAMSGRDGDPFWIEPDHPLNFAMRVGQVSEVAVHRFEAELASLASEAGDQSIRAHVKRLANVRNHLLYAADNGIPTAEASDDALRGHAQRVAVLMLTAIMIMQTDEHQLFALQCLEGLLRALDRFEGIEFDYSGAKLELERPVLTLERLGEGRTRLEYRKPLKPQAIWWGALNFGMRAQRPYALHITYSGAVRPQGYSNDPADLLYT